MLKPIPVYVIDGLLEIKVTEKYENSTVSRILDLVENASSKKSKTENFISKFSKCYTPIVVISALVIAIVPPSGVNLTALLTKLTIHLSIS